MEETKKGISEDEMLSTKDARRADTTSTVIMASDQTESPVNLGNERSVLYEKGLQFKRNESYPLALQCFLGCLQDMKEDLNFPELPQCLRNIAEIYSKMGEFEKAIEFVQAEKLFYETALIQAGKKESKEVEKQESLMEVIDPNASSEEAYLANEYEKLSKMCLKEKKTQLALEYAGKATQLRKKLYGDTHEITIKSLNQFTMVYAEMGKQQYSDAMAKMSKKNKSFSKPKKMQGKQKENLKENEKIKENKQEEIVEKEDSDIAEDECNMEQQDDIVTSARTMLLYFLFSLLASLLLTIVIWFYLDTDLNTLHSFLLQRIRYYYYYYFNSSVNGIRYI